MADRCDNSCNREMRGCVMDTVERLRARVTELQHFLDAQAAEVERLKDDAHQAVALAVAWS